MRWSKLAPWAAVLIAPGCGTIGLSDDRVPPDVQLDEDFFHCQIQPNVLTANGCATGVGSEMGSCHADRSALRLTVLGPMDPTPTCSEDGVITGGSVSAASM